MGLNSTNMNSLNLTVGKGETLDFCKACSLLFVVGKAHLTCPKHMSYEDMLGIGMGTVEVWSSAVFCYGCHQPFPEGMNHCPYAPPAKPSALDVFDAIGKTLPPGNVASIITREAVEEATKSLWEKAEGGKRIRYDGWGSTVIRPDDSVQLHTLGAPAACLCVGPPRSDCPIHARNIR